MLGIDEVIEIGIPRTLFGVGALARIGDLVKDLGADRALVVTDQGLVKAGIAEQVMTALSVGGIKADLFDGVGPEAPVSVVLEIVKLIKAKGYELVVAVGGGSTMDSSKAACHLASNPDLTLQDLFQMKPFQRKLPLVAVPTTAGTGSEWSAFAVLHNDIGDNGHYPIPTPQNFPNAVILDPTLTYKVPPKITADTGFDALCHAIEAYTCQRANPVSDMFAVSAIAAIGKNLRLAVAKGYANVEARYNMQYAASCAMMACSMSGVGLGHLISETLGPDAGVAHGTGLAVITPGVMEFTLMSNPAKYANVAKLLGECTHGLTDLEAADKSVAAVRRLISDIGLPARMSDIGITKAQIPTLVENLMNRVGPMMWMSSIDMTPERATTFFMNML